MKARGVLVLGMHRSGTSAVTGALSRLGLVASRPQDTVRGPWNPTGHFESQSLMVLDDRLLGVMGHTWWYPPPVGSAYREAAAPIEGRRREARRAFRRAYPRRAWVWKDPRACLLLPFWRKVLGEDVAAVVVARNPLDVADSLARRNGTSTEFGVALWERYNRLVLAHAQGMPVLVTRFDDLVDDGRRWTETMTAFLARVGLGAGLPAPARLEDPVDAELRHGRSGREDLAHRFPGSLDVFDALESAVGSWEAFVAPALGPEPPGVQAELDALGPGSRPGWRPPPSAATAPAS